MRQYVVFCILLQDHSTCFGCLPHASSGVHKTLTTASGTGHNIGAASSLQRGQVPDLARLDGGSCTNIMTCTGGCSYSLMNS